MDVLFVQRQPCIRTLKYAEGFASRAPQIRLTFAYVGQTLSELYGHGDERFVAWHQLGEDPRAGLADVVAERQPDLIHCHNGPDTLTNVCIDLFGGEIPIVHDIHDLMSARQTAYADLDAGETAIEPVRWRREEKRANEGSDAVIAVSAEIFAIARRNGDRLPQRQVVYANYIPERFIAAELPPGEPVTDRPLRVVYEGSLNDDGGHYDLRETFGELTAAGVELHIHPARPAPAYAQLAAESSAIVYHEPLSPEDLYRRLPVYDIGWCGFNERLNATHLDTVLPNKLFEYIACGLPVASFPHAALAGFIAEHRLGWVIDEPAQLSEVVARQGYAAAAAAVADRRFDFTVEANIGRVLAVYEELVASRPAERRV